MHASGALTPACHPHDLLKTQNFNTEITAQPLATPYRQRERAERGEVTIEEAAEELAVSPSTIPRMINDQTLPSQHFCKGAPWIIRSADLKREDVGADAQAQRSRRPSSENPRQRNRAL